MDAWRLIEGPGSVVVTLWGHPDRLLPQRHGLLGPRADASKMASQNVYDDPGFFNAYSNLPRSRLGLAGAPEWHLLRAMLPPLGGARVADLGCGYGWFSRFAAENGAASVRAFDLSEKMLGRAREMTPGGPIEFELADLETLDVPERAFDLVFSSLAFHYVQNADRLYHSIFRSLVPGGSLVFSTEHPIFTAPSPQAWHSDASGRRAWLLDGYSREGPRTSDWLAEGVVKQHRTVATTVGLLLGAGFVLTGLKEFAPTEEQILEEPAMAEEADRPMFMFISAKRPSN
ncbi:methyl transferase [Hyaloraphidium curvatum]|nr:methyl transferase [Hyaloraphidium curvatum]